MKKNIILISIALSFVVVFYDWLRITPFSSDWVQYIKHFNHLASLFGFVLMFYLFIFSSKMRLIEKHIGLDNMLKIHKKSPTFDNMTITMKELGDITSQAKDMQLGDTAFIEAPFGVFSYKLYDNDNLVFIAGGIGITPFISMLRYMKDTDDVHNNVILIWGNQSEDELIFQDELEMYEKVLKNFTRILVMSNQDDWPGEKGYIDKAMILRYIDEPQNYKYLICGPSPLLQLMKKNLKELAVEKKNVHYESFDF